MGEVVIAPVRQARLAGLGIDHLEIRVAGVAELELEQRRHATQCEATERTRAPRRAVGVVRTVRGVIAPVRVHVELGDPDGDPGCPRLHAREVPSDGIDAAAASTEEERVALRVDPAAVPERVCDGSRVSDELVHLVVQRVDRDVRREISVR